MWDADSGEHLGLIGRPTAHVTNLAVSPDGARIATGGADENNLPGGIILMTRDGNRIEGNFIGTDPTGSLDRGNVGRGVVVFRSSNNVIGGTTPAVRRASTV